MNSQTGKRKGKVFIVDDHPLVREWLTNLINQQADLVVCGLSESGPDAFATMGECGAEVAIVDLSLRDYSGLDLIKGLKQSHPEIRVLVLTMHEEIHYAERALRAGARGYVLKRETTGNVIEGIRRIRRGETYLSESLRGALASPWLEGGNPAPPAAVDQLSDQELKVFNLLGRGIGTRQIAETMRVSAKTVQSYCARMKDKLNLESGGELLREAVRWNDSAHLH